MRLFSRLLRVLFIPCSFLIAGLFVVVPVSAGHDSSAMYETTPPETSIDSSPSNPTNATSADFSFSGDDGGGSGVMGFECDLDGAGFSSCTSPQNFSGLSDGSHTFQVQAIDNDLNTDPTPASYTWTIDTTLATITIIKDATPADGTNFSFLTTIPLHSIIFLDDAAVDDGDGISDTFTTLVSPGNYTVLESVPSGWTLTNTNCVTSDPATGITVVNNTAFFATSAGETVTCTYTNVKRGTITVVEDAVEATGTDFTINLGGDATDTAVLDDAVPDDGDAVDADSTFSLLPGSYTLSETIPSNWDLNDLQCSTDDAGQAVTVTTNLASIDLNAGENVTCTFNNERQKATITVIKDAQPADGTNFSFLTTIPAYSLFFLDDAAVDDSDGISDTFTTQVFPGNYTVLESVPSGWTLTNTNCVTSDPATGITVVNNTAFFVAAGHETIICTYTNVKRGTITVVKDANPADGTDFTVNLGGDATNTAVLDDAVPDDGDSVDADSTFSLLPGSYTLSETIPSGWNLTDLGCTTDDTGEAVVITTNLASIDLDAGENVTCTFTSETNVPPAVTINQKTSALAQADPTSSSPINFTVTFSEAVTDFDDAADVTLSGTAGATTAVITGGPTTYNVAVSGMTSGGTVIATIPAGAAQDATSNGNNASTSTDNTVTFTVNTTTTITSDSPDPSIVGQAVTVNFTVTSAVGPNPSSGNVTVSDSGGATPCVGAVTAGSGTCNITLTTAGVHTLTATYAASGTFNGSDDTEAHSVSITIIVNTFADDLTNNGNCSLREAIRAANTNTTVDACLAGSASSVDNISLAIGTYSLSRSGTDDTAVNGDLDITGDTKIVGNVGGTNISGISTDRVFHILSGIVRFDNLTIKNGSNPIGGGINNAGTLTLNSVTVTSNTSTTGASGTSHGAGIYNTGTLTLNSSTVINNTATSGFTGKSRGGGIHNNGGTLTINSSTVTGNKAISGINGTSQGGGIYTGGGSTTLNSTTPSGNTVTAGPGGTAQGPNTYP